MSSSEKSGLLALLRENAHEMVKDKIINGIQSAIPVHIMQRYEIVNSLLAEVYSAIIDGIKKRVEAETAPRPDNSNKHRP